MAQNLRVSTICFRSEVVYDVISSRNVKTINVFLMVNFEVPSSNSFQDIQKQSFRDGGSEGGHRRQH